MDPKVRSPYAGVMQRLRKHSFWREWAVLAALFAVLLAPLAQSVARGYFADDAIRVASGEKPAALCLPGDPSGLPKELAGVCCDLCLPSTIAGAPVASLRLPDVPFLSNKVQEPAHLRLNGLHTGLPPPRGPPAA
jgi:hypothetical protein